MVEYEIIAKKTNFGDNRFENFFNRFGLKNKSIKIGNDEKSLIYEVERQKRLSPGEIGQIEFVVGIYSVMEV